MRYNYEVSQEELVTRDDPLSVTVTKRTSHIYPTMSDIERFITKGASTDTIREQMFSYMEGTSLQDVMKIENNWFTLKKQYELLYTKKSEKLTYLEEVHRKTRVVSKDEKKQLEEDIVNINDKMESIKTSLLATEADNKWLAGFRGVEGTEPPPVAVRPAKLHPALSKMLTRFKIKSTVRDTEDSIADISKIAFFSLELTKRLYQITSEAQRKKLSKEDRELIEGIFESLDQHESVIVDKINEQGLTAVTKLFALDETISKIIKENK